MKQILTFVAHERSAYPVYPPEKDVYAALNATPFAKVCSNAPQGHLLNRPGYARDFIMQRYQH
jgi:hypothetical protein